MSLNHSNPNGAVVGVLREAIKRLKFRDGLITAFRHDGKISKVKVMSAAQRGQQPAPNGAPGIEEVALALLDCLEQALRAWVFKFGKFKFKVVNMDVTRTTFSVSIRPHEEGLMGPLCGGK